MRVSALSDFSDAVEGCLGAWEQKSPILGRNDGPVLGAPGPPMGACISCRVGFTCFPAWAHKSPSHLTGLHMSLPSQGAWQGLPPSQDTPLLTSHRRYAGKAGPWGTGTDPGRCCTPGTACPWAGPPDQGCPASSPWCPQMAPATHTSLCMEKWSAPGKSALPPPPDPHHSNALQRTRPISSLPGATQADLREQGERGGLSNPRLRAQT